MAGRRRLRAGMVRGLDRHNGHAGYVYRRDWGALEETYDLSSQLARLLAVRVCVAAVNLDASTRALTAARRARERESGRRPSARDVERLARRQGLDDQAYAASLDRLRELAAHHRNGPPATPSSAAAAARAALAHTRGEQQ